MKGEKSPDARGHNIGVALPTSRLTAMQRMHWNRVIVYTRQRSRQIADAQLKAVQAKRKLDGVELLSAEGCALLQQYVAAIEAYVELLVK